MKHFTLLAAALLLAASNAGAETWVRCGQMLDVDAASARW
jgi:hypothetical protein